MSFFDDAIDWIEEAGEYIGEKLGDEGRSFGRAWSQSLEPQLRKLVAGIEDDLDTLTDFLAHAADWTSDKLISAYDHVRDFMKSLAATSPVRAYLCMLLTLVEEVWAQSQHRLYRDDLPWKEGVTMRAGGYANFLTEAATAWATDDGCGWGGGFYFDEETHKGRLFYGVDFMHFDGYENKSAQYHAFSPGFGFVKDVVSANMTDSGGGAQDNAGNYVYMGHCPFGEAASAGDLYAMLEVFLDLALTAVFGTPDAATAARTTLKGLQTRMGHFQHFAGDEAGDGVKVSIGQFLSRGTVLGRIDHTGKSAGSHLHMHYTDYADTVAMLPPEMRGISWSGCEGQCVTSKNTPLGILDLKALVDATLAAEAASTAAQQSPGPAPQASGAMCYNPGMGWHPC